MAYPGNWNQMDINAQVQWANENGVDPDQVVKEYITQNYGSMAGYINDPTLGPILLQAGREGWTPEKMQAAVMQTDWWKNTAASQRAYDVLTNTDPATANNQVIEMQSKLAMLSSQEGLPLNEAQLHQLATQFVRNGTTDQALIKQQVVAQAQYNPSGYVGTLGAMVSSVKQQAAQYLVPLSDQTAFNWAKQIDMGTQTADGFNSYVRQVAKGQFGDLADQIDLGLTPRQLIDPQIQQAAQLLEVDPDSINPMDQKFSPIISYADPATNKNRPMTLAETAKYIKGLPDWAKTDQANQAAASLGSQILKTFGRVG
jgi:hypothetical protein